MQGHAPLRCPFVLRDLDPWQVLMRRFTLLFSQVMDADRDVLLNVYSPRCGWCKKLTPIYHSLAEALVGVDSLTIAKVRQNTLEASDLSGRPAGQEVSPPSAARIHWIDSLII